MNVTFACPNCDRPARTVTAHSTDWQCSGCDQRLHLDAAAPDLSTCVVCGNRELYKKKDFPHWLGMTILVGACLASVFTYGWYEKYWTWAILLGSALFDGLLYLSVRDAIVCYRCHAHYRGFEPGPQHHPHELIIAERYRQERLRKQRIHSV